MADTECSSYRASELALLQMTYFDHNATHPLSPAARSAWLEATERFPGNPSSPHRLGSRAEAAIDSARERLAAIVSCDPDRLVFTSGATEGINAIIASAAAASDGSAWIGAVEHPCVLAAARRHFNQRHSFIPVTAEGVVEIGWLEKELAREKPALVAVMAANNETGVWQPWAEIDALCRDRGVPFLCDAAQWIGKEPAAGLGAADFMTGCAHKFGGPAGVGFMKCDPAFRPLLVGGPQEGGRRAGTENVAGILAMVAALADREAAIESRGSAMRRAREDFEAALVRSLPDVKILGQSSQRLWNTVSALMPAIGDCRQRWVVKLDKLGFAVSTGSACASGKEEPSHVLRAMGIPDADAGRVLRFSSGWETRPEDWQALLAGIVQAARELSGR